jgi:hypothetical protein
MTGNGGAGGTRISNASGGTASGGTTTNTPGGNGDFPTGGADVVGFNSQTGGAGGLGGYGGGDPGLFGNNGKIIFYYT